MLNSPSRTPRPPRVEDQALALLAVFGEDRKKSEKWYKDVKTAIIENEKLIKSASAEVTGANKRIARAEDKEAKAQEIWDNSNQDIADRTAKLNIAVRELQVAKESLLKEQKEFHLQEEKARDDAGKRHTNLLDSEKVIVVKMRDIKKTLDDLSHREVDLKIREDTYERNLKGLRKFIQ